MEQVIIESQHQYSTIDLGLESAMDAARRRRPSARSCHRFMAPTQVFWGRLVSTAQQLPLWQSKSLQPF